MLRDEMNDERLLFRRKFLAAPKAIDHEIVNQWDKADWNGYHLYIHPDLARAFAKAKGLDVVLLGYALDPDNPGFSNADVLNHALSNAADANALVEQTHRWCGRWALLVKSAERKFVLNDATGQMQIFYSTGQSPTVFGSSEHLVARVIGAELSERIGREFTTRFHQPELIWWPGDATPYDDVRCLVPNHLLELSNNKPKHFWPDRKKENCKRVENFSFVHDLLQRHFECFFRRFNGALALTGGLDSRLMLSFCRPFLHDLIAYTFDRTEAGEGSDAALPVALAREFRLDHFLWKPENRIPESFASAYRTNTSLDRPTFLRLAYCLHLNYPSNRVSIQSVNEIGRLKYHHRPFRMRAKDVANLSFMGDTAFAIEQFTAWHGNADAASRWSGFRIEDLFQLEQRMGRWSAMNRNEWDITQDAFEPLNSRNLLFRIMCIDAKDRLRIRTNNLYRYIINRNWPELLRFPHTPPDPITLATRLREYAKAVYYIFK